MARFCISTPVVVAAGLALAAGCIAADDTVDDEDVETTEQELPIAPPKTDPCPIEECGKNGSKLNEFFWELNEVGEPNGQGMRLGGIWYGAQEWRVDVRGSELTATRPGSAAKTGVNVVGGVMKVKDRTGAIWTISVVQADPSTSLFPVNVSGTTWSYVLHVTPPAGGRERNVCADPDSLLGEQDTLFMAKYNAVLFEGERYDQSTLTIRDGSVPVANWFNIGCASTLLSKLLLTHHAVASQRPLLGYKSDEGERQALMNALTAKYCPAKPGAKAKAFTFNGNWVSWKNDAGWLPHAWDPVTYGVVMEGRFDKTGATCLEQPRLGGSVDPLAIANFGPNVGTEIYELIKAECGEIPKCSTIENANVEMTFGKPFVLGDVP